MGHTPEVACHEVAPGDWVFDRRKDAVRKEFVTIWFGCPCGECGAIGLPVTTGNKEPQAWLWDGDEEKPTLKPSIRRMEKCLWHGFLTDGVFKEC